MAAPRILSSASRRVLRIIDPAPPDLEAGCSVLKAAPRVAIVGARDRHIPWPVPQPIANSPLAVPPGWPYFENGELIGGEDLFDYYALNRTDHTRRIDGTRTGTVKIDEDRQSCPVYRYQDGPGLNAERKSLAWMMQLFYHPETFDTLDIRIEWEIDIFLKGCVMPMKVSEVKFSIELELGSFGQNGTNYRYKGNISPLTVNGAEVATGDVGYWNYFE